MHFKNYKTFCYLLKMTTTAHKYNNVVKKYIVIFINDHKQLYFPSFSAVE